MCIRDSIYFIYYFPSFTSGYYICPHIIYLKNPEGRTSALFGSTRSPFLHLLVSGVFVSGFGALFSSIVTRFFDEEWSSINGTVVRLAKGPYITALCCRLSSEGKVEALLGRDAGYKIQRDILHFDSGIRDRTATCGIVCERQTLKTEHEGTPLLRLK